MTKNILIVVWLVLAVFLFLFVAAGIDVLSGRLTGISYLSIGDSIAAGYALPDYKKDLSVVKDSFAEKFGKEIGATKIDNIAVSGADTSDTLSIIEDEEHKKLIKSADIITIAIGSNDILSPGLKTVYEIAGVKTSQEMVKKLNSKKTSKIETMLIVNEISNAVKSNGTQKELSQCVENFKNNYLKIIERIKSINKSALIIALSFYNPYKDFIYEKDGVKLIDFGDTVQKYIDKMNGILYSFDDNGKNYRVAEISDIDSDKTNVLIDINKMIFDVDPHPNKEGHEYIFKQILKTYKTKNSKR